MKQVKATAGLFICIFCLHGIANAQNAFIFKGGNVDGWVSKNFIQGSSNIFHGGNADAWSSQNFAQSSSNIFHGGNADGWNSLNYIQVTTNIFKGGSGDGWNTQNLVQSSFNIFKGGIADGWSSLNIVQSNKNIFTGGAGDGWASTYRPQGTLPITLLYFTALKYSPTASLLRWQTSREINSASFDVERSTDALFFTKIGTVNGAVNSSQPVAYSFTDYNPLNGVNYYRLKQVDLDGHFIYSPARLVRFDELDAATVKYYPNPTNGMLNIEMPAANAGTQCVLTISNAAGEVVNQLKIASTPASKIQVDMSRYARGVYFIQLRTPRFDSTERIVLK